MSASSLLSDCLVGPTLAAVDGRLSEVHGPVGRCCFIDRAADPEAAGSVDRVGSIHRPNHCITSSRSVPTNPTPENRDCWRNTEGTRGLSMSPERYGRLGPRPV